MPKIKIKTEAKALEKTKAPRPTKAEPVPNATTRKAFREIEQGEVTHYGSVEELIKKFGS